jgi:hypothetical protein
LETDLWGIGEGVAVEIAYRSRCVGLFEEVFRFYATTCSGTSPEQQEGYTRAVLP